MATITECLVTEHATLARLFEVLEQLLSEVTTLSEARLLGHLVEGVLTQHGDLEQDLALAALDQACADKEPLDRLHQDHREIDLRLRQVGAAEDLPQALQLLRSAVEASRAHFRWEERAVFPLFDRFFQVSSLEELAQASLRSYFAAPPQPP